MKVLRELVEHHVEEEESAGFSCARNSGKDELERMAEQFQARKAQLATAGSRNRRKAPSGIVKLTRAGCCPSTLPSFDGGEVVGHARHSSPELPATDRGAFIITAQIDNAAQLNRAAKGKASSTCRL